MINNLDDSGDNFRSYFQKIIILQVFQQIFCEILIGGRKTFTLTHFLNSHLSENVQNDSSEFEGLIHEMMSKEYFIRRDISYINLDGERKLSTVSNFMKEFMSIN